MNIKDCFRNRILKKIPPNLEKTNSSIRIAEAKLEEAKKLFSAGFFSNAILSVYTLMFHSARALLYKDGIQEKSHYATYIYIKEKYSKNLSQNLLNSFNLLREDRHEILYGFEENISKEEVENAILDAEDFLMEVKNLL